MIYRTCPLSALLLFIQAGADHGLPYIFKSFDDTWRPWRLNKKPIALVMMTDKLKTCFARFMKGILSSVSSLSRAHVANSTSPWIMSESDHHGSEFSPQCRSKCKVDQRSHSHQYSLCPVHIHSLKYIICLQYQSRLHHLVHCSKPL